LKTKTKKKKKEKLKIEPCTNVTEFGFCVCSHCGGLDIYGVDDLPKVGENKCGVCYGRYLVSEEILNLVKERCESLRKSLDKVEAFSGSLIEEVDKGIDANLTIDEVTKVCRYYGVGIENLSRYISKRKRTDGYNG